jgi:integrase
VAGESALFVDPGEVPGPGDVAALGRALTARGWLFELMVNVAAYSGLRWGELAALSAAQVDAAGRLVAVGRKVVEVRGRLYVEAPKNRKSRRTIYPRRTPGGYPLAAQVARRAAEVAAQQAAGGNPDGIVFPPPRGTYWRSSNFNRRVLRSVTRPALSRIINVSHGCVNKRGRRSGGSGWNRTGY